MVKKKTKKEKIIEYAPADQGGGSKKKMAVAFAFVITWLIMIISGVYINEKLIVPSSGGTNNADIDNVKKRLHELEGGKGLINEVQRKLRNLENKKTELSKKIELNKEDIYKIRVKQEEIGEDENGITGFLPEELPPGQGDTGAAVINHKEEVAELKERVERLEGEKKNEEMIKLDNALSPLLLAMLNLRDRIQKSIPYEADLKIVKEISGGDEKMQENLKILEGYLDQGIVNISDLREEFETTAGKIVNTSRKPEDDSFTAKAKAIIYKTFSVRKVGADIEGDSVEAIVARAEAKLKYGNITKAVQELEKLDGEAALAATPWIEKAQILLGVEEVFASMYERVTELSSELK